MSKRRDDDSSSSSSAEESDDCETYFWGCTLTRQNPIGRWGDRMNDSRDSAFYQEHKLRLRQAVLGVGAVEGERNVVAVESEGYDREKLELPMVSLTLNHQDMCTLNLNFAWPATFRLTVGSGPVVITGEHHVFDDDDDSDDSDDDDGSSSSSSSDRSLKSAKKKMKKERERTPVPKNRASTSSNKESSKIRAKAPRRSDSSERPELSHNPLKSGSKGRTPKKTGSKRAVKKKRAAAAKKVAKKPKVKPVKVESD